MPFREDGGDSAEQLTLMNALQKTVRSVIAAVSVSLMLLCVAGCVSAPTSEEMASADFGTCPENYQAMVQNFMSSRLKDPYSAVYRFTEPRHGFLREGAIQGNKLHFGWFVQVGINAKNSYGGYTGEQTYYFLLYKNDQGVELISDVGFVMPAGMAGCVE
jgi:hypothetical protein